ncbi:MAG: hypothetical protein HWN81_17720 [Candidatus Lokiarchaeota archaeon]|nr:hypothetical protein [Candidatus Lokiarchaeota archaeon]
MSKCPYCKEDFHLEDFFEVVTKETKKGKIRTNFRDFKGEVYGVRGYGVKMWACPSCDTILGFSEVASAT